MRALPHLLSRKSNPNFPLSGGTDLADHGTETSESGWLSEIHGRHKLIALITRIASVRPPLCPFASNSPRLMIEEVDNFRV